MNRLTYSLCASAMMLAGCGASRQSVVVVYVTEDQVFSELILRDFEKATGIQVKAVVDTEEAKSTGVMNRLQAETSNPQADVYWANAPVRADVLRQHTVLFALLFALLVADAMSTNLAHFVTFDSSASQSLE